MFNRILIANRAAASMRIIRACRALGIESVAVFTDADAEWKPRFEADAAVRIGVGPATDSYLSFDRVINAAKQADADAIHPGYGFLAENAEFAERCRQENICFIGPSAETIALMGDKGRAKAFVDDLGIPTIPGASGESLSDDQIIAAASGVGTPLLVKAVAGGGGMGIRVVSNLEDMPSAISAVRQEAQAAFGDDRIILERFFENIRHIEVQIIADSHGNVVHVYDRECSLQRRRQKVIEEAPAVSVPEALRKAMFDAAISIAKASKYVGLGTVEFIVVPPTKTEDWSFFFLEMNTRLQVEHGISEDITGLDLVSLQIHVAAGHSLELNQTDISVHGHSIQARLCAEDANQAHAPSIGRIRKAHWYSDELGRVETGLTDSSEVSVFYDSLIAKIIAKGRDRESARLRLLNSLKRSVVFGVTTNLSFLTELLQDKDVIANEIDTQFVERKFRSSNGSGRAQATEECARVAAIALTLHHARIGTEAVVSKFLREQRIWHGDEAWAFQIEFAKPKVFFVSRGSETTKAIVEQDGPTFRIEMNGVEKPYLIERLNGEVWVWSLRHGVMCFQTGCTKQTSQQVDLQDSDYFAPIAGKIITVSIEDGASVREGDGLFVLEAMKMEHQVTARSSGVVQSVAVRAGDIVSMGELLAEMENAEKP